MRRVAPVTSPPTMSSPCTMSPPLIADRIMVHSNETPAVNGIRACIGMNAKLMRVAGTLIVCQLDDASVDMNI